jgi:hypothetical protein
MLTQLYNEYSDFTDTVARYPTQYELPYVALGLVDEAADELQRAFDAMDNEALFLELGDAQWYACRLCKVYGFKFNDIVCEAKVAYCPSQNRSLGIEVRAVGITAAGIAGRVKKDLRDSHAWAIEQRLAFNKNMRERLVTFVVQSYHVLDSIWHGNVLIGNYDSCLRKNVEKLGGRLARGTLHGDGDER